MFLFKRIQYFLSLALVVVIFTIASCSKELPETTPDKTFDTLLLQYRIFRFNVSIDFNSLLNENLVGGVFSANPNLYASDTIFKYCDRLLFDYEPIDESGKVLAPISTVSVKLNKAAPQGNNSTANGFTTDTFLIRLSYASRIKRLKVVTKENYPLLASPLNTVVYKQLVASMYTLDYTIKHQSLAILPRDQEDNNNIRLALVKQKLSADELKVEAQKFGYQVTGFTNANGF